MEIQTVHGEQYIPNSLNLNCTITHKHNRKHVKPQDT